MPSGKFQQKIPTEEKKQFPEKYRLPWFLSSLFFPFYALASRVISHPVRFSNWLDLTKIFTKKNFGKENKNVQFFGCNFEFLCNCFPCHFKADPKGRYLVSLFSHFHSTDGCSLESNEEWGHGWNPKTERVDERAKGDLGKNAQSHPLALHSLHRPLWHLWPAKHWRNSLGHLLGCWQAGKPNHCNALVCFLKLQICRRGANHSLGDELDWSCRKVLMDFYCEY